MPADPPVVEWVLPPNTEACFAGDCFGDGSCRLPREHGAARAGWAVVELLTAWTDDRPILIRSASGTLPGLWQDSDGAELYALLFCLRHLDLLSPRRPSFYTDSPWVADGWNGLWDTAAPWTAHWHLWQAVRTIQADTRPDIQVSWTRGHAFARALAQPSRWPRIAAAGNKAADQLAKAAARRHPWPEGFEVSLKRTHAFSTQVLRHFVHVVEHGLLTASLPSTSILRCLWPKAVVPSIPAHTLWPRAAGETTAAFYLSASWVGGFV